MKKLLLTAIIALTAISAFADLNGDGYYRVQNALTKRFAYLLDDKGSFDAATTSADVNALQLFSGFLKASADPSTVFYVAKAAPTGSDYYIAGQGTSLSEMLGTFLKIIKGKTYDGKQSYFAYASKSGLTKYLGDLRADLSVEQGFPSVDAQGDDRLWYINPLDANDNEGYFGIKPELTVGGKYYSSLYACFPGSAASKGVKFYSVVKVDSDHGIAVIRQLNGVVPPGAPVIVECANPLASDNRINVGGDADYNLTADNLLKGVYFKNDMPFHENLTPFDKASMRVLSSKDGKLVFDKADYDYVPRNIAYLQLSPADSQRDTYQVMTEAEYYEYLQALASLNPDGYYRVMNAGTKRYAYMSDNKGDISANNVGALQLFASALRATSDPATVFYMQRPQDAKSVYDRNLYSQSTDIKTAFKSYLTLTPADDVNDMTSCYAHIGSGVGAIYLGDAKTDESEQGISSTSVSGVYRQWHFIPVGKYFGITPSLTSGGKYYQPFYADFPFSANSEGMKFYTVTRIDTDLSVIVLTELKGTVPAGTPVIVECANPLAVDNLLNVGAHGNEAPVDGNLLSGVYFENQEAGHENYTAYDVTSMRSLAVADGKLVFAPAQTQTVARNQAFIKLSTSAQKSVESYRVMTADEYAEYVKTAGNALPDGYYRLQNASTKRYAYLNAAKGTIAGGNSSDLSALRLCSDLLTANSDPAFVFSLTSGDSSIERDLATQGTSFSRAFSTFAKIVPSSEIEGRQAFNAYAQRGDARVYLSDNGSAESVVAGTVDAAADWWFDEIDSASADNWFGVVPTVTVDGKYYCPFMAGFPFSAASDGVKFHIITKIDGKKGVMTIKEVEGSVIPAGTPVIVECVGPLASDNRLAPCNDGDQADVKGNKLSGAWFDCTDAGHADATVFDKESMRVLAEKNGSLAFVKADLDYVPRNRAYIKLAGIVQLGTDDYTVLKEGEQGVDGVMADDAEVEVYSVDGVLLKSGIRKSEVTSLGHGVYILRSAGNVEKMLVR